ncbi:diguanylate cyclase [Proteobacteria bacterium 005FR1]|nr:diguanylate cyclase [Proteobacteria bacterium 005FR1]
MQWWMIPSLVGTALSLVTAYYGYRYVQRPANIFMALLCLAAAWVCVFQWSALLFPDNREFRQLMAQLQYVGFTTGPVWWALAALAYCRYYHALKIARVVLWIIPLITIYLAFTNEEHRQIWQRFELLPGEPGLEIVYGPWVTVHVVHSYAMVATGTGLLVTRFARARGYKLQLLTSLLAPVAVFGLHFGFLVGLNPLPIDPTPTGLAVAALMLAAATRNRLFSVVPVARRATLDALFEGVIVVNDEGRIADVNRSAREIAGINGNCIGKSLKHWLPEVEKLRQNLVLDVQRPSGRQINIRIMAVRRDGTSDEGYVVVLTDVTEERASKQRLMQVQRELQELNSRLEKMAHTDSLTGLINRRRLNDVLLSEWSRAIRHGRPLSFILLDFDYFKQINDTYGHLAGDEVLEKAGEVLRKTTRPEDLVARYGGEEFAILLPETDLEEATDLARRLHQALGSMRFDHETLGPFQTTTSIGIAAREAADQAIEPLIARADRALYNTKNNGRDGISFASGSTIKLLPSREATSEQLDFIHDYII